MNHLIPEDSDWELEYTEVATDEVPQEMSYGWLVEAYEFSHSEEELSLTCNIEAYENGGRNYEVYVYAEEEEPLILDFRSRKDWLTGIKQILRDENNEVSAKVISDD